MGHIRLGRLPATKRWRQVVSLLARGAPLERIAAASAEAAENSLAQANRDPAQDEVLGSSLEGCSSESPRGWLVDFLITKCGETG